MKLKSVFVIIVISFVLSLPETASANLLYNGDFEISGEQGYTTGWTNEWNNNIFGAEWAIAYLLLSFGIHVRIRKILNKIYNTDTNICIFGDSAGGNLTIYLISYLIQNNLCGILDAFGVAAGLHLLPFSSLF